jgi:hypothetical protein
MSSATINRENGDKAKGFRLQKLRAVKLMLDILDVTPKGRVLCRHRGASEFLCKRDFV